jgi:hypothetical protein
MANTIIPAVGTRGRFILAPPFEAAMTPNTIYHLAATREYEDIEALGQNIFELFYKPFNLLESDLQADRAAGAVLVTLMTANSRPLYVPSTYVTFPDLNFKPYNQFVACLSFGPLPNSTIFDSVIQALKNTTSDFLGVEPEINIAFMPLTDLITPAEHDTLEAVRQAAIADRTTDYARLAEANAKIALLSQRNAILEKIIIDNGLLP